jgi:hypothetical protein
MIEKTFVLKPDTKGAAYYGTLYGLSLVASGYLCYTFSDNTSFFYLFLFSFWYALFAGVTTVLSQCLLSLPFSVTEVVVGPQQVILRKKSGSEKVITDGFDYSASGKSLVISGLNDERRKVAEVIRARSLEEKEYDRLIQLLKKLREGSKKK